MTANNTKSKTKMKKFNQINKIIDSYMELIPVAEIDTDFHEVIFKPSTGEYVFRAILIVPVEFCGEIIENKVTVKFPVSENTTFQFFNASLISNKYAHAELIEFDLRVDLEESEAIKETESMLNYQISSSCL